MNSSKGYESLLRSLLLLGADGETVEERWIDIWMDNDSSVYVDACCTNGYISSSKDVVYIYMQ